MSHFFKRSLIVSGGLGDLLCMLLFPRCTAAQRLALRSMPMHNVLPSLAQGVICWLSSAALRCTSAAPEARHMCCHAPPCPFLACRCHHYPATCAANCPPSPTIACRCHAWHATASAPGCPSTAAACLAPISSGCPSCAPWTMYWTPSARRWVHMGQYRGSLFVMLAIHCAAADGGCTWGQWVMACGSAWRAKSEHFGGMQVTPGGFSASSICRVVPPSSTCVYSLECAFQMNCGCCVHSPVCAHAGRCRHDALQVAGAPLQVSQQPVKWREHSFLSNHHCPQWVKYSKLTIYTSKVCMGAHACVHEVCVHGACDGVWVHGP